MFGGVGFMVHGYMACGVHGNNMIVRVGAEKHQAALAQAHTRVLILTGKPMLGWILVEPAGLAGEDELREWVAPGLAFAQTLPAK